MATSYKFHTYLSYLNIIEMHNIQHSIDDYYKYKVGYKLHTARSIPEYLRIKYDKFLDTNVLISFNSPYNNLIKFSTNE